MAVKSEREEDSSSESIINPHEMGTNKLEGFLFSANNNNFLEKVEVEKSEKGSDMDRLEVFD
jgi:hypothetical protein